MGTVRQRKRTAHKCGHPVRVLAGIRANNSDFMSILALNQPVYADSGSYGSQCWRKKLQTRKEGKINL